MNPLNMKLHNRQKSGVSPSSSETSFKSPNTNYYNISTPKVDINSDGVNPLIHQCPMHRNRPLGVKEANLRLKREGVIKK